MRNILGLVSGYGLLTVTGNEHRQMRKAMNPAFSLPNLMNQTEMYFDSINVLVEVMRTQLANAPDGKVMHMYEWMSKVTLDIICDTAFGYHSDSLRNPHNALTRAYEALIALQSGPNLALVLALVALPGMPTLLGSALGRQLAPFFTFCGLGRSVAVLVDSAHKIRTIARDILRERVGEMVHGGVADGASKRDVMSLLVRARTGEAKDGYTLSDEALVEQVLTFLGAGHETTASGLSWTLWLLATHPDVQDALRAELAPVFAKTPRPDYREMKDLKLLECVVMESLRVLPPVPITLREAARDDWVDGVFVPKGTLFYFPIRAINTWHAAWGADADAFRPARWLAPPRGVNAAFSFQSFIAGPHACIGRTMAISEMKTVLAAMVANFEFRPAYEGQVAKPTAAITMKPEDNMPLLVTPVRALPH